MKTSALFIPLMKHWFEKFVSGAKRVEYRKHGARWNKDVCCDGRPVVLACGYGWPRLRGRITHTTIIPAHKAPKAARQLFGDVELIRIHITDIEPIARPMSAPELREENEG